MPNLIYILSLDHSGSTLIDLAVGGLPRIFSLGEMQFFTSQLLQVDSENPQNYCSCGEKFHKCNIWSVVLRRFSEEIDFDVLSNPSAKPLSLNLPPRRKSFRLHHRIGNALIESATAMELRSLQRIMLWLYRKRGMNLITLLDILSEVSGSDWLVDSSKNLARYLYLREFNNGKTFGVFLVRNVEGYAASSYTGLDDRSVYRKMKHWTDFHSKRLPKLLSRQDPTKYCFISYEEFCRNPRKVLSDLGSRIGLSNFDGVDMEHVHAQRSHTVQGNPIRLKKESVPIHFDERWRERLSKEQQHFARQCTSIVEDTLGRFYKNQ